MSNTMIASETDCKVAETEKLAFEDLVTQLEQSASAISKHSAWLATEMPDRFSEVTRAAINVIHAAETLRKISATIASTYDLSTDR